MNERKFTAEERARRGAMAKEYSDMLRKKWERYRRLVGDDLHDLLSSMRQMNNTRIGSALTEALHDPKVKLSEWILTHMKPAFGIMLHERDRDAIGCLPNVCGLWYNIEDAGPEEGDDPKPASERKLYRHEI